MARVAAFVLLAITFIFFSFFFFACSSPNYAYRPSSVAAGAGSDAAGSERSPAGQIAQVGKDQGVLYEIGKNAGSVDVISFGPIELKEPGMPSIRMLKMRMVVKNEIGSGTGNQSWTLNTARQWLVFPEHGSSQPAYIGTPDQVRLKNPPEIKIPVHETRTVDLYYPLPKRFQSAAELPRFVFQWQLQTGTTAAQSTTVFARYVLQGKRIAQIDARDLIPQQQWTDVA